MKYFDHWRKCHFRPLNNFGNRAINWDGHDVIETTLKIKLANQSDGGKNLGLFLRHRVKAYLKKITNFFKISRDYP